jgi:hypothetical protein
VVYGSVTLLATAVGPAVAYRLPHAPPVADVVTLLDLGTIAHFLSVAVLAVMCVVTAHVSLATRVLPRWTAWLGLLAAASVLAATVVLLRTRDPVHLAATVLLAWIVAVSIVLAARRRPHQPPDATAPTRVQRAETTG